MGCVASFLPGPYCSLHFHFVAIIIEEEVMKNGWGVRLMYTLVWVHPLLWGEWKFNGVENEKERREHLLHFITGHSLLGVANRELSGQHQHNKRTSSCCCADRVLSVWVCSECCSGHQVTHPQSP